MGYYLHYSILYGKVYMKYLGALTLEGTRSVPYWKVYIDPVTQSIIVERTLNHHSLEDDHCRL